jgi:hypothetical protein
MHINNGVQVFQFNKVLGQALATYSMCAKFSTQNDFQWHAEWIEIHKKNSNFNSIEAFDNFK